MHYLLISINQAYLWTELAFCWEIPSHCVFSQVQTLRCVICRWSMYRYLWSYHPLHLLPVSLQTLHWFTPPAAEASITPALEPVLPQPFKLHLPKSTQYRYIHTPMDINNPPALPPSSTVWPCLCISYQIIRYQISDLINTKYSWIHSWFQLLEKSPYETEIFSCTTLCFCIADRDDSFSNCGEKRVSGNLCFVLNTEKNV